MRTWEAAPGILRSRNTFGAGALLLHAAPGTPGRGSDSLPPAHEPSRLLNRVTLWESSNVFSGQLAGTRMRGRHVVPGRFLASSL